MQTRRIVGVGMLISGLLAGVTQAATSASAPPPRGGTITIGELGGLPGLDPIGQTFGYPEAGGIELAAIYDTLMRFDPDAGVYEPQLAAGLEPNDDFSEWTLSLRPDVTFTDATMLDAEAVRASILRHTDPSARSAYRAAIGEFVQEMSVADPLTLVFTLAKPWSGFPVMLASTVGMITSPTAVEAAGEDFATSPGGAGAGPFMVDSFKPGEDLTLVRNPDYHGGEAPLDGLRFVLLNNGDPSSAFEALESGTLTAAVVRDPQTVADAAEGGYQSIEQLQSAAQVLLMNSGIVVTCSQGLPEGLCADQPDGTEVPTETATSDVRVRRAVAAAIDVDVVNDRTFAGTALAGSALFPEGFRWTPDVAGPSYDPDEARRLVEEAKADGWDGVIRVLASTRSDHTQIGLTVQAQLEAVGMQVELDNTRDFAAELQQVTVAKDFDLATYSLAYNENADGIFIQMSATFNNARFGYTSPEMVDAVDALRLATNDDEITAALGGIQEIWTRDVPAAVLLATPGPWISAPELRGVMATASGNVLLDEAWIEQ